MSTKHIPILVSPIVDFCTLPFLSASKPSAFIDATLGGAGHCHFFLEKLFTCPQKHYVLAIDQDEKACHAAKKRLASYIASGRLQIIHARFSDIARIAHHHPVLGCFADLGYSSDQLEDPTYGLSFQRLGPLDMRLSLTNGPSCLELLQTISQHTLETILFEFGEERFSKQIAKKIIDARLEGKTPTTTFELVALIEKAIPAASRYATGLHFATRSFQALRIAVNQELQELETFLTALPLVLQKGAHAAILSFHSLEDRMVKHAFSNQVHFEKRTQKMIRPSQAEQTLNPRSCSAKLRLAQKRCS